MEKGETGVTDWAELSRELERLLHLRTHPIAFRRLEKAEELEKIPKVRKPHHFYTLCQAMGLVRIAGQTIGITKENLNVRCATILGLRAPHPGCDTERVGQFFETEEDTKRQYEAQCNIPLGNAEAVVMAPLASEKFDPEMILIFGTPAQMLMMLTGLQWRDYTRFQFYFSGEDSCADSIAECYNNGTTYLSIPCYGERVLGSVQDDELLLAIPSNTLDKMVAGIRSIAKGGLTYPITPVGLRLDMAPFMTKAYGPALVKRAVEGTDVTD